MTSPSDTLARNAWLMAFKTRKFVIRHDSELEKALQLAGANPTKKAVKQLMDSHSGCVTYSSFKAIAQAQFAGRDSATVAADGRDKLMKVFKALDTSNDGYLSFQELRTMLTKGGDPISEEEVSQIFAAADTNGDGRLDFDEFCSMTESTTKQCHRLARHQQACKEKRRAGAKEEQSQRAKDEELRALFLEEMARQRQALLDDRRKIDEERQRLQSEILAMARETTSEKRQPASPPSSTPAVVENASVDPALHETPQPEPTEPGTTGFVAPDLQAVRPSRTVVGVTDKKWAMPTAEVPSDDIMVSASDTNLLRFHPRPPSAEKPALLRRVRHSKTGAAPKVTADAEDAAETGDSVAEKIDTAEATPEVEVQLPSAASLKPVEPVEDGEDDDEIVDETVEEDAPEADAEKTFNTAMLEDTAAASETKPAPAAEDESPALRSQPAESAETENQPPPPESAQPPEALVPEAATAGSDDQATDPPAAGIPSTGEDSATAKPEITNEEKRVTGVDKPSAGESPSEPKLSTNGEEADPEEPASTKGEDADKSAAPEQPTEASPSDSNVAPGIELAKDKEDQDTDDNDDVEDLVTELHATLEDQLGDEDSDDDEDVVFGDEEEVTAKQTEVAETASQKPPSTVGDASSPADTKPAEPKEEKEPTTAEPELPVGESVSEEPQVPAKPAEEDDKQYIRPVSFPEAPSEADLKAWHCLSFKGCMFANDPSVVCAHQYMLTVTAASKLFAKLALKGPAAPIDVGFVLARLQQQPDDSINAAPVVLDAAVATGIRDKDVCMVVDVEPGEYVFAPYTTCVKLASIFASEDRICLEEEEGGSKKNGPLLDDDKELLPAVKTALQEIFRRHDLDGSGGLDQHEFVYFHDRCGEETLEDEDWNMISETFETTSNGELTVDGFVQLQMAVLQEVTDGDYLETWQMLDAMGYNRKLELSEAWPFSCEVDLLSDDSAIIAVYELTADATIADDSLALAAGKHGTPLERTGSEGGRVDVKSLAWGADCLTVVAQNKAGDSVKVMCDYSASTNYVSHRQQVQTEDLLVAGEKKILHHFVPDESSVKPSAVFKVSAVSAD